MFGVSVWNIGYIKTNIRQTEEVEIGERIPKQWYTRTSQLQGWHLPIPTCHRQQSMMKNAQQLSNLIIANNFIYRVVLHHTHYTL